MLEKIDLSKKMDKDTYKQVIGEQSERLGLLQRELRTAGIPVMIVFEGMGAAGKGTQINRLIQAMDPRGFEVFANSKATEEEQLRPFLWRFWTKTPADGRIAIFDRSWYRQVTIERFDGQIKEKNLPEAFQDILSFERQLDDGGMVIIKLFLYISQEEQKKRFKKLEDSKETSWRVTKDDWRRNKEYDRYLEINEEMLQKTDTERAPWSIIEATDKDYAAAKIMTLVADRFEAALREKAAPKPEVSEKPPVKEERYQNGVLSGVDLTKTLTKEEYKKEIDRLQKRLEFLHSEIYRLRIPVVLGFEGWDAGGKGGAIKRLTSHLDPRGYRVNPTASPNDIECTIICGGSGTTFRRRAISPSSTGRGTAASWWNGSRASVRRRTGSGPIRKSTRWRPTWPMPEPWSSSSGSILTRTSRNADSRNASRTRRKSGRLRTRTGETGKNGTSTRPLSTRCWCAPPQRTRRGLSWKATANIMPA